ncbi:hypothetical protein A8F94_16790 [Bacillus sp. FJAT-27225]|uniref:hypothetical protein n=1 Tax=Bacillus sp. FJAT-27225 TaxID=1743144 RepID=UPI00080C2FCC|nr:hypothetical protein [Bacillus sp. FJAT-27225]OCA84361.1 hypothetical protein A8F94_16790 [Bacillus sp. FJAT-27225]
MQDFRTLKFLDKFSGLFERLGADYKMMRAILAVKLAMDGRRAPVILGGMRKKEDKEENKFIKSLWLYGLFGLLLMPIILLGDHFLLQMTIYFGALMFILMTSLISDFSSVLLDVRDRTILLPKPVSRKTVSMARAVHISVYMFFLTMALAAASLIVGLTVHGPVFFLLLLVSLILVDLLIIAVTALVYYFILRFFDGEKMRDIINYIQILLTVSLALGYQLVGRTFEFINFGEAVQPEWWQAFIPPVWLASLFELFLNGTKSQELGVFAALAFLGPIIGLAVYIRLMPSFEKKMQKLAAGSGPSRVRVPPLNTLSEKLICPDKVERAFYRFALAMMKSERDFRLKVYPSIGLSVMIPLILVLNQLQWSSFGELSESKYYLSIYMAALVIPTSVMMLKFSGRYKASWLFRAVPIESNAPLFGGTLKAFLVRLYLPVYSLTAVGFCFIFGIDVLPSLIGAFLAAVVYSIFCMVLIKGSLPFSESFEASQENNGLMTFVYLIPMFGLMGIHWLFTFVPYGPYLYILIMLVAVSVSWRVASKTIWV